MHAVAKGAAPLVDAQAFREGMRRFAAGVTLITTVDLESQRFGMTATAVCSVSAAPPTLLVCINRHNSSFEAIRSAGRFAVNVLAAEDRPLADRFASPITADEKFASGLWHEAATGAPILESALTAFDCAVARVMDMGTHGIVFGEIRAIRTRAGDARPLLYARGAYGTFTLEGALPAGAEQLRMPDWRSDEWL